MPRIPSSPSSSATPPTIPANTSAEAFGSYIGGDVVRASQGDAWQDLKAFLIEPARDVEVLPLPAVSEPFIAWTASGEVEFDERENDSPWITHHITQGSMFLTSGGAPYDCRWRAIGPEPFQSMAVFIALPLQQRALEEVHGADAARLRLRDVSAFRDDALDCYMVLVRDELMKPRASPLHVQGLAQVIAIHLARHYTERIEDKHRESPALPGFKVRQLTTWIGENLSAEINLEDLAARVKLSKFHFQRLFKKAVGASPSRYQLDLRMKAARRLLRETERGVIEIALELGYTNPSHFAQVFRRQTGQTPSDYRRQR